jgi:hypothetical protein
MFDSTKKFLTETDENSYLAVTFQSCKMVVSKRYHSRNISAHQKEQSVLNFEKKEYNGEMSRATKAYLRKKLDTWYMTLRWNNKHRSIIKKEKSKKLVFFTLTLPAPQCHPDNIIKRECLNSFLISLKSETDMQYYFWRAETQINGNIHFHVITDCYIDKTQLQTIWNKALSKLDYIDLFEQKHGHRNAPSTQIQVIPNDNNVIEYLMKYSTKDEGNRKVQGRIWGMSDKLRELQTPSADCDSQIWQEIDSYMHDDKKNVYQDENCLVIQICHEERLRYYQFIERYEVNVCYCANYLYLYCGGDLPVNVRFPVAEPKPIVIPEWILERNKQDFEKQRQYSLF